MSERLRQRPPAPSLAGLLGGLKALAERGGAALGDVYAVAASSFLNGLEQIEDHNAERRSRQHQRASHERVPPTRGAARPKSSLTAK